MQPDQRQLTFRNLAGEQDYPLLLDLNLRSRAADHNPELITVEAIAHVLANMDGLTAEQGVILALFDGLPIGYSRLGWYSSRPETRLYYQVSFLPGEYRSLGWWPLLVMENERRLGEFASEHPMVAERYYQAWAEDHQQDWMAALTSRGYQVMRRFNNMLYQLGEPPSRPLPAGLEVRPVLPEHMRMIWEAQREMNAGLFENVAEDWLDEKYPAWLAYPANNPRFWQVAWEGEQLAGMVLARIDDQEFEKPGDRHGFTEHIYVRPGWRGRGLASALIARSLGVLKEQGVVEAELGVDAENESAAFRLYERIGYKTFSVDTWFRKPMDTE
jgi:ribosomal protein S18 acetylase RimI-like enzyme